jgi:signal transduction histidine kinase
MSNIKMAAYLLKRAPIGKDYLRYVEILEAECLREIDLINNLLDLQHLDPLSQSLQEMALQPWLAQLMEQFQAQAKARNQHLELEIAPQLPVIRLDPNSLQRILSELVSNACKHSPTGSLIRLAVATSQGTLIITVSNPADIPGSELPRIFDKFYRIPKADPWNQGGTGLGLALVQQLVRHLQGDLQVSSQEGLTIFTLKIPFHSGKIAA